MKSKYKVALVRYWWHKLKRFYHLHLFPAVQMITGAWYCDSCHRLHPGNVIEYTLDYKDYFEDIRLCGRGIDRLGIVFKPSAIEQRHGPFYRNIQLTSDQICDVAEKVGEF